MAVFNGEKILLIGAGKMGGALLEAWLKSGMPPSSITLWDTHEQTRAKYSARGCKVISDWKEISDDFACIVLAVKPQSMGALLPELASHIDARQRTVSLSPRERLGEGPHAPALPLAPHPDPLPEGEGISSAGWKTAPLILSIAAGKALAYFEDSLPGAAIVRAMPNTPAVIGMGISALCANSVASEAQKQLATALLAAAGEVVWLDDETLMNAVTALSGSGPAYMFLYLEALVAAGAAQGLPEATARTLALHTMRGSAELALQSNESLAQLRKNVTSPGGTTQAALEVLMHVEGLQALIRQAVIAAVRRAGELA